MPDVMSTVVSDVVLVVMLVVMPGHDPASMAPGSWIPDRVRDDNHKH